MKSIGKINKSSSLFFEKINKIVKSLARLTNKRRTHKLLILEMKEEPSLQIICALKG